MNRILLLAVLFFSAACSHPDAPLPRGKASVKMENAFAAYLQAVADSSEQLHSIMVLQHGKVLMEKASCRIRRIF